MQILILKDRNFLCMTSSPIDAGRAVKTTLDTKNSSIACILVSSSEDIRFKSRLVSSRFAQRNCCAKRLVSTTVPVRPLERCIEDFVGSLNHIPLHWACLEMPTAFKHLQRKFP